jgi:predicted nucleic acid-binding protein
MNDFFDTSVLVAALREDHVHHEPSFRLLAPASKGSSCCAAHSLAELYASMTALPVRPPIPPEQAFLFIQEIRDRLTCFFLTDDEYYDTLTRASQQKLLSGKIYDALILRCASKSQAQNIYTWNLKHFQLIAPDLAAKIRTP